MEIAIIEIKEKNIKTIQRYLRKREIRKNGGATLGEIAFNCKLTSTIAKATLDWMFRGGKVMRVRHDGFCDIHYAG